MGNDVLNRGKIIEDRQDLLGHKAQGRITTHYSAAELGDLVRAANKVCVRKVSTGMRSVFEKMTSREVKSSSRKSPVGIFSRTADCV